MRTMTKYIEQGHETRTMFMVEAFKGFSSVTQQLLEGVATQKEDLLRIAVQAIVGPALEHQRVQRPSSSFIEVLATPSQSPARDDASSRRRTERSPSPRRPNEVPTIEDRKPSAHDALVERGSQLSQDAPKVALKAHRTDASS